jgi:hypothetical protein
VGADDDRLPRHRGLQDVVPAGRHEAAPHENDVGQWINLCELAESVEHQDLLRRPARGTEARAPAATKPGLLDQCRDRIEALGMTRCEEEARAGNLLSHPLEGGQNRLLFPFHGAAGDDQRAVVARRAQEVLEGLGGDRRTEGVELQVASDAHAIGRRPHVGDALGVSLSLHQEEVHLAEHAAQQRADPHVPGVGPARDPTVDHGYARAAPTSLVDQVRPDLRLHEHEQTGAQLPQGAAHGRRPIVGREEKAVCGAHVLLRDRAAGQGRRREEHEPGREALLERRHQRPGRQHLTHRDGVDPDRRLAGRAGGRRENRCRQAAHPLAEGLEVLAGGPAPPKVDGGGQDEAHRQEDAVEEIQAMKRSWSCSEHFIIGAPCDWAVSARAGRGILGGNGLRLATVFRPHRGGCSRHPVRTVTQ